MTTNARDEKWSSWIDWPGSQVPPVSGDTVVDIKYRYGGIAKGTKADAYRWTHKDTEVDIIAYRYKIKEPESAISEADEEECLQLTYERMNEESVKVSIDDLCEEAGKKHDNDKPAMDLIPPYMEEEVGMVLTFGAKKYAPDNWRKVSPLRSRYLAAAQRHINALKKGEQMDPESGLHHAAHAICCLMFLGEVELEPEHD